MRRIDDKRLIKPVAIVATVFLVGFISYAVYSATNHQLPAAAAPTRLRSGVLAPPFALRRLGASTSVALKGRSSTAVVINFFASWCSDCVAELDAFGKVSNSSSGVRFIGVDSLDSNPGLARRLLARAGIGYDVGVDPNGNVAHRYLISALPVTFFVTRSGVIKSEIFGPASAGALRAGVRQLGGATAS